MEKEKKIEKTEYKIKTDDVRKLIVFLKSEKIKEITNANNK